METMNMKQVSKTNKIKEMLAAKDPNVFLEGACHFFAMVLKERYGYEIRVMKKRTGHIAHAFCIDGNEAIDVTGRRPLEVIIEIYRDDPEGEQPGDFFGVLPPEPKPASIDFQNYSKEDAERDGLLYEPNFVSGARTFAAEYMGIHDSKYKRVQN
jgi:hypothetical protein